MLGDPALEHRTRATAWLNLSAIYRSLWNLPVAMTHALTARELVRQIGSGDDREAEAETNHEIQGEGAGAWREALGEGLTERRDAVVRNGVGI